MDVRIPDSKKIKIKSLEIAFLIGAMILCIGFFVDVLYNAMVAQGLNLTVCILFFATLIIFLQYVFRYLIVSFIYGETPFGYLISTFIVITGAISIKMIFYPNMWFFCFGILFFFAAIKELYIRNAIKFSHTREVVNSDIANERIFHHMEMALIELTIGVILLLFFFITNPSIIRLLKISHAEVLIRNADFLATLGAIITLLFIIYISVSKFKRFEGEVSKFTK